MSDEWYPVAQRRPGQQPQPQPAAAPSAPPTPTPSSKKKKGNKGEEAKTTHQGIASAATIRTASPSSSSKKGAKEAGGSQTTTKPIPQQAEPVIDAVQKGKKPDAKHQQSPRIPTPGEAPPEQKSNPTFGAPQTNGAKKSKSKSQKKVKAGSDSSNPLKRSRFTLRSLVWRGSLYYLLYATLWLCPPYTIPTLSHDAPSTCTALYNFKHNVIDPVYLPIYKQHLQPHIEPYLIIFRAQYNTHAEPVIQTAARYAKLYGRPALEHTQVYLQQGQDAYMRHAHPVVVDLQGRVKEQYDVYAKEHVDRVVGQVTENYDVYLGEYIGTAHEATARALAAAQDVHERHVAPAIEKYGPVVQEQIERAKPVVKQGVDTAIVYYQQYVDPTARSAGIAVKDVWDNQVVPAWNEKVVPEAKRIHSEHVGPKVRELYGMLLAYVTGKNATEASTDEARHKLESKIAKEAEAIVRIARDEATRIEVEIERVYSAAQVELENKVEQQIQLAREVFNTETQSLAGWSVAQANSKKPPHERITAVEERGKQAVAIIKKALEEVHTVLNEVMEKARNEMQSVYKEADVTAKKRGREAVKALGLTEQEIVGAWQGLDKAAHDEAAARIEKAVVEAKGLVETARSKEVMQMATKYAERLASEVGTLASDAAKEVYGDVNEVKRWLEEEAVKNAKESQAKYQRELKEKEEKKKAAQEARKKAKAEEEARAEAKKAEAEAKKAEAKKVAEAEAKKAAHAKAEAKKAAQAEAEAKKAEEAKEVVEEKIVTIVEEPAAPVGDTVVEEEVKESD